MIGVTEGSKTASKMLRYSSTDSCYLIAKTLANGDVEFAVGCDGQETSVLLSDAERRELADFLARGVSK
jgi:hypothetical protein